MKLTVRRHMPAEVCDHISWIHTDVQCLELSYLSGLLCISKISCNLLVTKHKSAVWCLLPETGREEWRGSKTTIINPSYNCASKASTHTRVYVQTFALHAQTEMHHFSQIVPSAKVRLFAFPLIPSLSTALHYSQSKERTHIMVWGVDGERNPLWEWRKVWTQTSCLNICVAFCQLRLFC